MRGRGLPRDGRVFKEKPFGGLHIFRPVFEKQDLNRKKLYISLSSMTLKTFEERQKDEDLIFTSSAASFLALRLFCF